MRKFEKNLLSVLKNQYETVIGKKMICDDTMNPEKAEFYFKHLNDNLIEPMSENTEKKYLKGNGNEIRKGKMKVLRSSAAMTYNLLGNDAISVSESSPYFLPGAYAVTFEFRHKTLKRHGIANIDALLEGEQLIFCEMKLIEWLLNYPNPTVATYLDPSKYSYPQAFDAFKQCLEKIGEKKEDKIISRCKRYDALQMFKHSLAIYNYAIENNIKKKIRLVNCLWNLSNLKTADSKTYLEHLQKQKEEFQVFYNATASIRKLFENSGIDFDILFLEHRSFIRQFDKTKEQLRYLERY